MSATLGSFDIISTGLSQLDDLLGGGFSSPGLVEIWGPPAAGKSLLAHYIAGVNLSNHVMFWLDTDRTFRIQHIKHLAKAEAMNNLKYAIVPSLDSLFYYLDTIESSNFSNILIVIDSLASIVRSEVINVAQRNRLMMALIRKLKLIAAKKQGLVLLTNQITTTITGDIATGETATGGLLLRQQMKYVLGIHKIDEVFRIDVETASYLVRKPEPIIFIPDFKRDGTWA